ncbi:MAG: glycosyltransferase [Anaerolineae bacterium]|nr:MAG: glycosyltransferase [Anaerolineae bacterium]
MISTHTCPLATLGGKETGGMNVYVRDLSRELGRRGIAVDVFTRQQDPDLPPISGRLGPNCRVIHLPAGPVRPYDKNQVFYHLPEFVEGIVAFAEREGLSYHVLHSHYWLSGWVALALRERWGSPVIQMFHTLGHMKNSVAQRASEIETDLRIEVEPELMAQADWLVAATPLERAQMAWLYGARPERIRVIPCGVDLNLFKPIPTAEARARLNLPREQQLVLFVGRIEPLKGIDTLMRAMALLVGEFPHCWQERLSLAIIGGDPNASSDAISEEMERLKRLRAELGIGDLVCFLGAQDQDRLNLYYSAAEVVVVPSHYESFGMVALEAMACGTPVIASKVGGLAFTVQDGVTGFHVPDRDPEALADRMTAVLCDAGLRERLGRQAAQWAGRYSWPAVANQIVALYDRALAPASLARAACS